MVRDTVLVLAIGIEDGRYGGFESYDAISMTMIQMLASLQTASKMCELSFHSIGTPWLSLVRCAGSLHMILWDWLKYFQGAVTANHV